MKRSSGNTDLLVNVAGIGVPHIDTNQKKHPLGDGTAIAVRSLAELFPGMDRDEGHAQCRRPPLSPRAARIQSVPIAAGSGRANAIVFPGALVQYIRQAVNSQNRKFWRI